MRQMASVGGPVQVGPPVQTVELTSKRWKKLVLWGGGMMFLGPCVCIGGMSNHDSSTGQMMLIGTIMPMVGLVLLIWGKVGAYWHNK
jgi:hypothetical protein